MICDHVVDRRDSLSVIRLSVKSQAPLPTLS